MINKCINFKKRFSFVEIFTTEPSKGFSSKTTFLSPSVAGNAELKIQPVFSPEKV